MILKRLMMHQQLIGQWRRCCRVQSHVSSRARSSWRGEPPFNILFLGTDSFALETLKALHHNRLNSGKSRVVDKLHVVSTSSKTAVADFARSHDLDLLTWPPELSDLEPYDLGVLVSFGRMVPRKIITKLPYGILNVHPSLLPRWRGASPVFHSVLNADKETGVSVISILPSHFDRGPILQQKRLAVPPDTSAPSLAATLAAIGADLLLDTLQAMPGILDCATPQADTGVTYAHKATTSMAWVNWDQDTAQQIRQQYLALSHMLPLRSSWNQQTVKLLDMVMDTDVHFSPATAPSSPSSQQRENAGERESGVEPGTVVFDPSLQAVCVKCMNGWVAFHSVVLRKQMSAVDFFNGYLSKDKHPHVRFQSASNGLFHSHYWDSVLQPKVKRS